jgi:hypothetical protein
MIKIKKKGKYDLRMIVVQLYFYANKIERDKEAIKLTEL